jgi:DNA-directed RNA polymerase specialized sigma24 family protein
MTGLVVQEAPRMASTVRLAAEGDEAAFTRLVVMHRESMARVAFVICGDADATRDAVQSAWSIAWRRLPTLRDPD